MRKFTQILSTIIAAALLLTLMPGCSAKAKANRHLQRGDKYFLSGDYAKAEVEYLNVLQRDSLNACAVSRLGTIYFEEEHSRAFPFVARGAQLNPNDLDLHVKLGKLFVAGGNHEESRRQALLVLSRAPTNADAPLLFAESAKNQKQADEFRGLLEKLAAQVGDTAPLRLAFGALHLRDGNLKAAETDFKRAQALDPRSSAAHFSLGKLCLLQKDLKGADLELKAAAEFAPPRSICRLKYADFKIAIGEIEDGKHMLAEMTAKTPDYLPAWLRLAELALAQKNYDECASLLNQPLARDSGNYEAHMLRGRLMFARGDAPKAVAEFERMSTTRPFDLIPQVHYQLALAHLFDNNDTAKALRSIDRALSLNTNFFEAILLQAQINIARDDPASAITTLNELLKRNPRLPQAYVELAAAYQVKGNLEAALATYQRLSQLFPEHPDTPALMGMIYFQQGRKDEARQSFTQALALAPGNMAVVEKLAELDLADEQFAAALARVQQEIDRNPTAAEPLVLMAKIHLAQAGGIVKRELKKEKEKNLPVSQPTVLLAKLPAAQAEMDQAEAVLLKAIELNPNLQGPYLILARLYVDTRKNQKALEKLNAALVKDPRNWKALMLAATIQNETREFSAARTSYEKLLAVNPGFYPALNNLAALYSEQFGKLDEAYEMARKARDLLAYKPRPGEDLGDSRARSATEFIRAYSSDTLGWVAFKRGEFPYALSLLQESAGKLSQEPEVQFHLGMACYMSGQEERAQDALKRSLSFNQDFPGKEEAVRRLAILAIDGKTADPKVVAGLEKQLRDQPGDPVLLARLAAIYVRDKTPEKAVQVYEAALKANAKNPPVMVKLAILIHSQNPQRALDLARDAYKLAPDDPEISCALGRLVFQAGDHKWALSLFQQCAGQQAREPEVLYDLALAYYSVGRISEAETTMRRAASAAGDSSLAAEARRFLELVPLSSSSAAALPAESRVQEILKSNPDDVPALMVAALCFAQRGDAQAARQACERVLKRYPNFAPAWKQLASLYAELGDDQKAYEMATRARQAFPEDAAVANNLGMVLCRQGDYRNSARLLDECVRKGSADASAMYYLGKAHYQLSLLTPEIKGKAKERKESQEALQQALALNVQTKLADDARRLLAELK